MRSYFLLPFETLYLYVIFVVGFVMYYESTSLTSYEREGMKIKKRTVGNDCRVRSVSDLKRHLRARILDSRDPRWLTSFSRALSLFSFSFAIYRTIFDVTAKKIYKNLVNFYLIVDKRHKSDEIIFLVTRFS